MYNMKDQNTGGNRAMRFLMYNKKDQNSGGIIQGFFYCLILKTKNRGENTSTRTSRCFM